MAHETPREAAREQLRLYDREVFSLAIDEFTFRSILGENPNFKEILERRSEQRRAKVAGSDVPSSPL